MKIYVNKKINIQNWGLSGNLPNRSTPLDVCQSLYTLFLTMRLPSGWLYCIFSIMFIHKIWCYLRQFHSPNVNYVLKRILAISSASPLTQRSLITHRGFSAPAAPKVERQDETSCDVTWEPLAPMKGDPILYNLQCMMGNSDFKQVQQVSTHSWIARLLPCNRPAGSRGHDLSGRTQVVSRVGMFVADWA